MPAGIPVGEAAILGRLPMDGDTLKVDKANGERVQAFGKAFRTSIEREHRNAFYRHNRFHLIFGLALSAVVLVAMILPGGIEAETMIAVLSSGIPAAVMAMMAVSVGRSFRRAKSLGSRIKAVVLTAFGGFIALSVLLTTGMGLFDGDLDGIVLLIVGGLVMTDVVFFFLMGAPTPIGRKMMDGIAGLEQYLTLAEKDRMNMQGAPQMSPRHFETLLPYAVALGVEKPWSRAFDAWLTSAAAAGAAVAYMGPGWYSGGRFEPGSIGSDIGGITSSLSDSFTASLPAPKSSSSGFGGGGSSGGGGGGGGGGGW